MPNKSPVVGNQCSPRGAWDHGGKGRIECGYDHRWMKLRLVVLARDQHLCQRCRRAGRVTAAKAVDHIRPKAKGGSDDLDNPGGDLRTLPPRQDHRRIGQAGAASH
jgi:5-methylcytosine-specific restriction endonuclease McrA